MLGADIRKPTEGAVKKNVRPSDRIGEQYANIQGLTVDIVNYNGKDKYNVVFKDSGVMVKIVNYSKIIMGQVYDTTVNEPGIEGRMGVGKHTKSKRGKITRAYKEWLNLIQNYDVEKGWREFQIFANWFYKSYDSKTMKSWVLTNVLNYDKIINDSKYYDAKFCAFLPNVLVKSILLKDRDFIGFNGKEKKYSVRLNQFASKQKVGGFLTNKEAVVFFYTKKRDYINALLSTYKLQLDENVDKAISQNTDRQVMDAEGIKDGPVDVPMEA